MRRFCLSLLLVSPFVAAADVDGSLDPAFGAGGRSYFGYLESDTLQMRAIAKYPASGRIWMFADDVNDPAALYIARTLADGQADTVFGPSLDGRRRTTLPAALIPQSEAWALDDALMQDDGKPVVFGGLRAIEGEAGPFPALVCRLNAAGGLDTSFDGDGCQTIRSLLDPAETCRATDAAVAPDDSIVVIGNCVANALPERPFVTRLLASGAIDLEFGAGAGVITPPLPVASAHAQHYESVVVRPDGRIAVLGTFEMVSNGQFDLELGIAQFDLGGSPDPSYSNDGFEQIAFDLGGDNHDRARDLALRADGKLVALGEAKLVDGQRTVALIAQVDENGVLDPSFDGDGMRSDTFDDHLSLGAFVASLDLDPQDRGIVAASDVLGQPEATVDAGTDFWFALPPSVPVEYVAKLMIASDVAATGVVTSPALAQTFPFSVAPGAPALIDLPEELHAIGNFPNGGISGRTLHVTADAPVSVVPRHGRPFSLDTSVIVPTIALGAHYRVMSWGSGLGAGSELVIVAAHAESLVTITPSVVAAGHAAGVPFQVLLQQGEAYHLRRDVLDGDLSGSTVVSTKPIAVFSGHTCAEVPNNFDFCDLVYEQQRPIESWGTNFVMVPTPQRPGGDVIRVLADRPDTSVYANGVRIATLMPGETHSFLRSNPTLVTTSQPASVAQFARGCSFDGTPGTCPGDPYMVTLEPLTRWASAQLALVHNNGLDDSSGQRHLNVVIPQAAAASMTIDGVPIDAGSFATIPGSGLAFAQLERAPGAYRVQAAAPFFLRITGLSEGEAYAHTGAVLTRAANGNSNAATADDVLLRLTPSGARDLRFGSNGLATISHPDYLDRPIRALADGDGILVGSAVHQQNANQDLMLAYRLNATHLFSDGFE